MLGQLHRRRRLREGIAGEVDGGALRWVTQRGFGTRQSVRVCGSEVDGLAEVGQGGNGHPAERFERTPGHPSHRRSSVRRRTPTRASASLRHPGSDLTGGAVGAADTGDGIAGDIVLQCRCDRRAHLGRFFSRGGRPLPGRRTRPTLDVSGEQLLASSGHGTCVATE